MDATSTSKKPFRSGFVAILGRPNVGKSSLMNRFVGEKVAIVSNRPQTTRNRILGVAARPDAQVVFVDTPGIHIPRTKLGEYMVKAARDAREGVDAVLVVVDGQTIGAGDRAVMDEVARMNCPKFLAVNKTDIVSPEALMPKLAALSDVNFDQIVCVSARNGDNVDALFQMIVNVMPEGPRYFPDDVYTDQMERQICAEMIREKALLHLTDEIPHGIGVDIRSIAPMSQNCTEIHADIYCERASHKAIIIGKHGSMLTRIGSEARVDIEKLLGKKVMLRLWVKVREDWRNRSEDLNTLGYQDD